MKGPLFIGGQERSGTSLVRAVLGSHSAVALFEWDLPAWRAIYPECRPLFGRLANAALADVLLERLVRDPKSQAAAVRPDPAALRARLDAEDLVPLVSYPALAGRVFASFFEEYARLRGRPFWGLKTPESEFMAAEVFAAHPNARFLHVLRDPFAVCASAKQAGWTENEERGLEARALRWSRSLEALVEHHRTFGAAYLGLRYERFVEDPETFARLLCDWLELGFEPAMLEMTGHPGWSGSNSSFGVEAHEISASLAGKPLSNIDPEEHGRIETALAVYRGQLELVAPGFELERFEAEMLCALGEALFEAGRLEGARRAFRKAVDVRPDVARAHNDLAVLHFQDGRLPEALDASRRALALDPFCRRALLNCADVLRALRRVDEARTLCQRYLERFPRDPEVCAAAAR